MIPTINVSYCKGCNLCIEVCPKKVFDLGTKISDAGFYYPTLARLENCTNYKLGKKDRILCEICWLTCPEHAIEYEVQTP